MNQVSNNFFRVIFIGSLVVIQPSATITNNYSTFQPFSIDKESNSLTESEVYKISFNNTINLILKDFDAFVKQNNMIFKSDLDKENYKKELEKKIFNINMDKYYAENLSKKLFSYQISNNNDLFQKLNKIKNKLDDVSGKMSRTISVMGGIIAAMGAAGTLAGAFTFGFGAIPFAVMIAALSPVVAVLAVAKDQINDTSNKIQSKLNSVLISGINFKKFKINLGDTIKLLEDSYNKIKNYNITGAYDAKKTLEDSINLLNNLKNSL